MAEPQTRRRSRHQQVLQHRTERGDSGATCDEEDGSADGRIEWYPTVTGSNEDEWTGTRGRVDQGVLASLVDGAGTFGFVCGPSEMVSAVCSLLCRLGVPDERIRREEW